MSSTNIPESWYEGKNTIISQGHLGPPAYSLQTKWKLREVKKSFYLTLRESAVERVKREGDWVWINCVATGKKLGAKEAFELGDKFASYFQSIGLKAGQIVQLLMGNSNLVPCVSFGVWRLGAVISNGHIHLEPKIVALQLEQTEAAMVLCVPETSRLAKTSMDLSANKTVKVLCLGPNENGVENILPAAMHANGDAAPAPHVSADPKKELSVVFWSSGTTGIPKGICHSHFSSLNYLSASPEIVAAFAKGLLTDLSFFFAGGFCQLYLALLFGQTLHSTFGVDGSWPDYQKIFEAIIKHQPEMMTFGSHHYAQLGESSLLAEADPKSLRSVKVVLPAGAAVPDSIGAKYRQKMENLKVIINPYGQSEAGILLTGPNFAKMGEVNPFVEIKIKKPESEELCLPGEPGEICAKSPTFMLGYLQRPEETRDFFSSPDGFIRTGDIATYDEERNLFYVDRLKELIKYKNDHVAPTQLEEVMQTHPAVMESLTFGKPDPEVQQIIVMLVVLKPEFKEVTTEAELVNHVNSQVADHKAIRGGVIFCDKLPRNSVGKLVRRNVQEFLKTQNVK